MNALLTTGLLLPVVLAVAGAPSSPEAGSGGPGGPRIIVTSVLVDDQEKALRFYTEVLGFIKKQDVPAGEARWLTVTSPSD